MTRVQFPQPGHIDVWLCSPDAVTGEGLARCAATLDAHDRESVDRLVRAPARRLLLVSRAFVRAVLARYGQAAPGELRFSRSRGRAPRLEPPSGLVFSVSHTEGLVTCAVAGNGPIGLDAERHRPGDLAPTVGRRFFAPQEVARLNALAPEDRQGAFFSYWVLKEAYAKARGRGISLGLATFSVAIDGNDARIESPDELPGHGWWLALMEPTPDVRLGLAYQGPRAPTVTVRWATPFGDAQAAAPRLLAATPPLTLIPAPEAPPSTG